MRILRNLVCVTKAHPNVQEAALMELNIAQAIANFKDPQQVNQLDSSKARIALYKVIKESCFTYVEDSAITEELSKIVIEGQFMVKAVHAFNKMPSVLKTIEKRLFVYELRRREIQNIKKERIIKTIQKGN
jgi:hypothetical protein